MAEIITTTVVGSYPQPDWLIDRDNLRSRLPPRVRVRELWRIPEPFLEQAQDHATIVAIRDMERAGIDIISDGEIRRESYSKLRWRVSISTIRARPSTARDTQTQCLGSSARYAASGQWKCMIWTSYAATRTTASR